MPRAGLDLLDRLGERAFSLQVRSSLLVAETLHRDRRPRDAGFEKPLDFFDEAVLHHAVDAQVDPAVELLAVHRQREVQVVVDRRSRPLLPVVLGDPLAGLVEVLQCAHEALHVVRVDRLGGGRVARLQLFVELREALRRLRLLIAGLPVGGVRLRLRELRAVQQRPDVEAGAAGHKGKQPFAMSGLDGGGSSFLE